MFSGSLRVLFAIDTEICPAEAVVWYSAQAGDDRLGLECGILSDGPLGMQGLCFEHTIERDCSQAERLKTDTVESLWQFLRELPVQI
jgi:hypothetical protein